MSEKKHNMSASQKKRLVDLMSTKKELRNGKFTSSFTKNRAQKEWEEISNILNALPGATKSWKAWRKSWQDLLSKTKTKQTTFNRDANRTGGGAEVLPLSEVDTNLLSLMDPRTIYGHAGSQESVAVLNLDSDTEEQAASAPAATEQQDPQALVEPEAEAEETYVVMQIVPDGPENVSQPASQEPAVPQQAGARQKKINIKTLMKEKLELKKKIIAAKMKFYSSFIENMERQTSALQQIASALGPNNL